MKEMRILIVENSKEDAELIMRELQKDAFPHVTKWAESHDEFLKALQEFAPSIILCDYKMPTLSAPEALEIVKERCPEIPFIVVSGSVGEDIAVEMMRCGAADYVMKDRLNRLVLTVRRAFEEALSRAECRQREIFQEINWKILQILNKPASLRESIHEVLETLKIGIGLDAVGMRMRNGNDFPFFVQKGFTEDFVIKENSLLEPGSCEGICRNSDGSVSLECTCGLIISGKTDPSNSLFTRGGSFWTNDSRMLLKLPADQDPRRNPRNQCIYGGYLSIALVPIRTKDQIIGLLQFNDRKQDRFSLPLVERLENIALHVGELLMRKQAENIIRENEARLEDITFSMADWVWEVDKNGVYTHSSSKGSQILGFPPNEILGKTPFDFMPPEEVKRVGGIFSKIMAQKAQIRDLENWNIRKDGRRICLLTNGVPLLSPQGELMGYRGVDKDITERKIMEESLRQSEEKYRSMVDNINIGVAMISPAMEVLFINNQMKKWNPHVDLKDKPICFHAFNNPPRKEICSYCPTARTLKDGLVHEAVTETPMNGKIFNYKIIASPIKDENGRVIAAIEMVEDITERKQIEEKLRENHRLLTTLLERAPGALYQFKLSPDGKYSIPFAAGRIVENFGVNPEEIREDASPVFKVIHPEDLNGFLRSIEESIHHLSPWDYEFRVAMPGRPVTWQRASSIPEKLPDQSIVWYGFISDITEQKTAEEALRSKTALLEAQTDSTLDGILIIDQNSKRLLINQRFIEMFHPPESVLADPHDELLLKHVTSLTKYPEKFLEKIHRLNDHPHETSRDEIEFKNGMVLDRYSAPVLGKDGKNYGRIWLFRDITERKKLERDSKKRMEELEVFYKASVGREERILQLKRKVDDLQRELEKYRKAP